MYDAQEFHWRITQTSNLDPIGAGVCVGTAQASVVVRFPRKMRIAPTMAVSNSGHFLIVSGTGSDDTNAMTAAEMTTEVCLVEAGTAAVLTNGRGAFVGFDATSTGFIEFSARL